MNRKLVREIVPNGSLTYGAALRSLLGDFSNLSVNEQRNSILTSYDTDYQNEQVYMLSVAQSMQSTSLGLYFRVILGYETSKSKTYFEIRQLYISNDTTRLFVRASLYLDGTLRLSRDDTDVTLDKTLRLYTNA